MAKKSSGDRKIQMGFTLEQELRDDFVLLARIMPGNLSPAGYLRKLIQEEVDAHSDLLDKAKELRSTVSESGD